MDIHAVRVAMAAQISSVIPAPLTVTWFVPDMATEPLVWIRPESIEYDRAYGPHGMERINFQMTLVASRADDQAAQINLDQYVRGTGPLSVKAALEAGRTQYGGGGFGGVLDDLWVSSVEAYRYYVLGDTKFLGASWTVMVIGKGSI